MDKNKSLQNLLHGTATEEDIALLKRLLASGEISIGGNVNQSVIIIGSGNTVELPPAALDRLNARPMLGNLDRDLTGEEIASGLRRLDKLLPNRAPVLLSHYKEQVGRLRPTLKTEGKSLSETARRERLEALAAINSICVETVDISFNGLSLGEEAPKYDARSPFRGLESFRPADSEFFFGREALTQKLVGKIKAHSFLAVLGASGSGKSSLVMAGVIPALDSDYVIFCPGTKPLDELESARGKSLIVVDQFEELFTLTRDESTRVDFIARLLDESSRARIILTLRSDFLGEVGAYRTLSAEIQNHLEIIPPMDLDELRRAMEGQAGVTGLRFEADLSQQILDDVAGEPGAMPLLQHALWELWNRRHGRNLRASEYRAFGGVKQAITSTAEKVYADCSKPEQDQVRDIFLRLTRLDEGDEGRDTRRRVPLGDLIPSGRGAASITLLLDKLANARLIVKTVNENKTEVEVAHEALIRHWERLQIWLNEDRDVLRLRESVRESAKEWDRSGRHESLLNSRWVKLDEALLLAEDSRYRLTEIEQAYLKGCVGLRNREQREGELRRRITLASALAVTVTMMVILIGWSISSTTSANKYATQVSVVQTAESKSIEKEKIAEERMYLAQSLALSSNAQLAFESGDNDTAIALAIEANKLPSATISAQRVLAQAVYAPGTRFRLVGHNDVVSSVDINYDDKIAISGSWDGTIKQWDLSDGSLVSTLIGHNDRVYSVTFNHVGDMVASSSKDKSIILWDVKNKSPIHYLYGHSERVYVVAFNPKDDLLASGSLDKTVILWDVETGNRVQIYNGHTARVNALQFSYDGQSIFSGSSDGFIIQWGVDSANEIKRIEVGDNGVTCLAINPDGDKMVSGSWGGTIRMWDIESGEEITRFDGHVGAVESIVFSPDGKYIISGSYDNSVRIWEVKTGKEVKRLIGHTSTIWALDISSDGKNVISGSADKTLRYWDIYDGLEISRFAEHLDTVFDLAVTSDDTLLISVSTDKTMRSWNIIESAPIHVESPPNMAMSVAFTSDNNYALVGFSGGLLKLLDVKTQNIVREYIGHKSSIRSVEISNSGRYAITGSFDDTAIIWNIETGEILSILQGHTDEVFDVDFCGEDKYALTASGDGTIAMWEITSGHKVLEFYGHASRVTSVSCSPDGFTFISGSEDRTIRLWDINTGNLMMTFTGHEGPIWSVDFDPGGGFFLSGAGDHTVRYWDVNKGMEVYRYYGHNDAVYKVKFSFDGTRFYSSSRDRTIRLWNLPTLSVDEIISWARSNRYIPELDCSQINIQRPPSCILQ